MKHVHFIATLPGRLDKILAAHYADTNPEYSRSQLKRLIELGQVSINAEVAKKAGALVEIGDRVDVVALNRRTADLESYAFDLNIVHEDPAILVLDKPFGISMHPGAGNRNTTLVNALLHHFRQAGTLPETMRASGEDARPGIVHRLDKDTTGLVVVAKTLQAHAHLSKQFAARSVGRRYVALAFLTPRGKRPLNTQQHGIIDAPLGRSESQRKEMAIRERGGKRAVTHWEVLERLGYGCVVRLRLETGRTHQIRLHLTHIGCPLIGDKTYGEFSGLPGPLKRVHEKFGRQALHAGMLEFEHPLSNKRVLFESEIPDDMRGLIDQFRSYGAG